MKEHNRLGSNGPLRVHHLEVAAVEAEDPAAGPVTSACFVSLSRTIVLRMSSTASPASTASRIFQPRLTPLRRGPRGVEGERLGIRGERRDHHPDVLVEIYPELLGGPPQLIAVHRRGEGRRFIFLRTDFAFIPSIPVGRTRAQAVTNPDISSTA